MVGKLRSLYGGLVAESMCWVGGWREKSTIMLNSAQYQVKLPTGALSLAINKTKRNLQQDV